MRTRRLGLKLALLIAIGVVITITAAPLFSQTTANLSGYVTDQSGAAIPSVQLRLQNVATGASWTESSNATGHYIFTLIPPGAYTMTVTKTGFSSVVVQNLTLNVNASVRHDIIMALAQVRQQVTVQASPVQVNSETASIGSVVGSRETVSLPLNGRDFLQLSELSAGVVPPPTQNGQSTAQGSLGGGRQTETVDISGTREQSEIVMFDGIPEKQFFSDSPLCSPQ